MRGGRLLCEKRKQSEGMVRYGSEKDNIEKETDAAKTASSAAKKAAPVKPRQKLWSGRVETAAPVKEDSTRCERSGSGCKETAAAAEKKPLRP